ncbi:hypothetical protein LX64_00550 [Chitinophaga skermanii]|uniref:DUF4397 domain-containing protein n=1 Tax=Chitinophaga skermanii TaxID=331697 RepID=A0A327R5S5_9BACT|nr:DUF4397 domain-containing protein [Chitinophaga skermanii]RAJ10943.1 hypothetical protein LX64_00550 [Chitinophaga skermanii]
MKKITSLAYTCLAAVAMLAACKKNEFRSVELQKPGDAANVKLYYYPPQQPNCYLKLGDDKLGASLFYSLVTPATAGLFESIPSGKQMLRLVIPHTGTNVDSLQIGSYTTNMEGRKFYSMFVYDTAKNFLVVEDDFSHAKKGYGKFRLANIQMNVGPIDIRLSNNDSLLISNVDYGTVSPFIEMPVDVYNIKLFKGGTKTLLTEIKNFSPLDNKFYTIVARGWVGQPTASGGPLYTTINNL